MNRRSYDLVKGKTGDSACQWSAQSYTLAEIAERFALPMVIKSDGRSGSLTKEDYRVQLTNQPMLLYSTRTKEKLMGKHVPYGGQLGPGDKKKQLGSSESLGPGSGEKLVIPEDYPGWFVHLKSTSGEVKCYGSIEQLFASKVNSFVTGTPLVGLQMTIEADGRVDYRHRQFLCGSVFRTERLYVGKVRVDAGMKFLLWRRTKLQDVKYLKCFDVQNREILLAMNKTGKFFQTTPVFFPIFGKEKQIFNTADLFSLRQIISPVMLIQGEGPRVVNFTGIMQIQRKFTDRTVVAATTVDKNNHVVLEISIWSSMKYHLALNSKDVFRHGSLGAAFKHCKRRSDQYVQRIRVPFALLSEEGDDTHTVDNSDTAGDQTNTGNPRKLESISESLLEEDIGEEAEKTVKREDERRDEEMEKDKMNNNEVEEEEEEMRSSQVDVEKVGATNNGRQTEQRGGEEGVGKEAEEKKEDEREDAERKKEDVERKKEDEDEAVERKNEDEGEEIERKKEDDGGEKEGEEAEEKKEEEEVGQTDDEETDDCNDKHSDVTIKLDNACDNDGSDFGQDVSLRDVNLVSNGDSSSGRNDEMCSDEENGNSLNLNVINESEVFTESFSTILIPDEHFNDRDLKEQVVSTHLDNDSDKLSDCDTTDGSDSGISDKN